MLNRSNLNEKVRPCSSTRFITYHIRINGEIKQYHRSDIKPFISGNQNGSENHLDSSSSSSSPKSDSTNGYEKYSIKQLDSNEVIYLETLDQVKLYHERWKVVIGYDLLDLESNYRALKNTYKVLLGYCHCKFDNQVWSCTSTSYY